MDDQRSQYAHALETAGLQAPSVSATLEQVWDLDPAWVLGRLQERRSPSLEAGSELGCWLSEKEPSHDAGYTKMNLRNTLRPGGSGVLIGCQPWLHQLAVIAGGRGACLLNTTDGSHEVSHRCHNARCFNPDHVVVETSTLNHLRSSCRGAYILECACCGTVFNPCRHACSEHHLECILPRRVLEGGRYHINRPFGPVAL